MSAVMSTLSIISGARRTHHKLSSKSPRRSGQHSDTGEAGREDGRHLGEHHRSASLQTLEVREAGAGGVAQLETLEAKMASIEVSLSARARRGPHTPAPSPPPPPPPAAARELDALRAALRDKDTLIHNLKEQLSSSLSISRISAHLSRAASPRERGGAGGSGGAGGALSAEERRALEDRAAASRRELDAKRALIAQLKRQLDKLHVTDNIDTRIEQAELEYRMGREELELLGLVQQARTLQMLWEHAHSQHERTLYACARQTPGGRLVCAEVEHDAASPQFAVSARPEAAPGLWVHHSQHEALLCGDRVLEVNGVGVAWSRSADEVRRALAVSPRPARLVLLRAASPPAPPAHQAGLSEDESTLRAQVGALREQASEARKGKEGLRADNLRLTHRISYLEEQVAELVARERSGPRGDQVQIVTTVEKKLPTVNKTNKNITNINITSCSSADVESSSVKSDVQVFQKGPDITTIVANLPGLGAGGPRSRCGASGTRLAPAPPARMPSVASTEREARHRRQSLHTYALHHSRSSHSLDQRADVVGKMRQSLSQACLARDERRRDYQAETAAALEIISQNARLCADSPLRAHREDSHAHARKSLSNLDRYATDGRGKTNESDEDAPKLKKTNWAEKKTLAIIEQLKQSQRSRKSKRKNKNCEDIELDPERDYTHHQVNGKVLENSHNFSSRTSKIHMTSSRPVDSECESVEPSGPEWCGSQRLVDYSSEPGSAKLGLYKKRGHISCDGDGDARSRPLPPKKPLRLSLHRAQSSQSVCGDRGIDCDMSSSSERRPSKRTYKGDRSAESPRERAHSTADERYPAAAVERRAHNGHTSPNPRADWC